MMEASTSDTKECEETPLKSNDEPLQHIMFGKIVISSHVQSTSLKHEEAIQQCLSTVRRVRFIGLLLAIDYMMRSNIFILYAKTLRGCPSASYLGIVIYASYFASGVMCIMNGIIGDNWRFDYLLCIAAWADVITFWIEATATHFTTLATVYIIGGQAIQAIVYGFIVKSLPIYYATQYQIAFAQTYVTGTLLGPLIGGLLSYYLSYRAVFITSAVLASIIFVFCMIFIRGNHDKIVEIQAPFESLYLHEEVINVQSQLKQEIQTRNLDVQFTNDDDDDDGNDANINDDENHSRKLGKELKWLISDDYKFPIWVSKHKQRLKKHQFINIDDNSNTKLNLNSSGLNYNLDIDIDNNDDDDHSYLNFSGLSKYRIFLILTIVFGQSTALASETAVTTWYAVYIEDKYNGTVLLGTSMFALLAVCFLLGSVFIRLSLKWLQKRRDLASASGPDSIVSAQNNINSNLFHIQTKYNFGHFLVFFVIASCVTTIILAFFIIPENVFGYDLGNNSWEYTFWIYVSMIGFSIGVDITGLGAMLVPLIPHGSSGTILGLRVGAGYCIRACSALVIGCLWNMSYEWLWYGIGLFSCVSLVVVLIVAMVEQSNLFTL